MSGNTAEVRLACLEFAQYLGINLRTESHLLELAEELLYKVPSGWYVGVGKYEHTRIPYFYNKETGESGLKHPLEIECFHKVAQARDDLLKMKNEENEKKAEFSDKKDDTLRLYRLLNRQNEQAAQMQADYSARANYLVAKHERDL